MDFKKARGKAMLCLVAGCVGSFGHANPPDVSTLSASSDVWQFHVAPYIWALNMDGRVGVGPAKVHLDESLSDILSDLSWAGMIWIDASKDNFGIFVNSLYAVLSQDNKYDSLTVNVKNNFGLFSAGVSYVLYHYNQITLTPYVGARYTLTDTTIKIENFGLTAKDNQNWTDPIVGARLRYDFNKRWQVLVAGDVGGTNMSSDKSYDAQGYVGYSPQTMLTHSTWYLGYRLLYQDYEAGSGSNFFSWDMKLHGPVMGVSFAL